jgi:RNase adapter protein RapZ
MSPITRTWTSCALQPLVGQELARLLAAKSECRCATSSGGRPRLSLEKPHSVMCVMPSSSAHSSTSRALPAPWSCRGGVDADRAREAAVAVHDDADVARQRPPAAHLGQQAALVEPVQPAVPAPREPPRDAAAAATGVVAGGVLLRTGGIDRHAWRFYRRRLRRDGTWTGSSASRAHVASDRRSDLQSCDEHRGRAATIADAAERRRKGHRHVCTRTGSERERDGRHGVTGLPHLLVVTGMSGAGKTLAMKALEDLDFFCIDNLPPSFLPQVPRLQHLAADSGRRVAVAMDVRGGDLFADLFDALDTLQADAVPHRILFLDCSDDILVRRFSETRRRHPVDEGRSLFEHIAAERRILAGLRDRADLVLDTTGMTGHDLKVRLARIVTGRSLEEGLEVDVVSFGFKHGVPLDADLMFDVRFLPNPFYEQRLRSLSGLDDRVAAYVFEKPEAEAFVADVLALLQRWAPHFARSGKPRLTVAIGCTGGQHRSVAIAERLAAELRDVSDHVSAYHRDLKPTAEERAAASVPAPGSDD